MAITLGTNSGFVTTSPTADPAGSGVSIDTKSFVTKHTTGASVAKITEVGWWCDNATQAANFEVGLYAADGADGVAGTRLYVDNTNAKGTSSGWKKVTVDWSVSASTAYWIAVQLDDTATTTQANEEISGGAGSDSRTSQTTLNDPYGGGGVTWAEGMIALYALTENATVPRMKINIGDTWKTVTAVKINIGDVWKTVTIAKLNIGDTWKST